MTVVAGKTMFVRFIGTKVCFTVEGGRFHMADKDECSPEELAAAERGGEDMPLTTVIDFLAR
jgi:hypothetical protein